MKYFGYALSKLCHLWGIVLGVGALAVIPAINPPLWVVLMLTVMSVVMLIAENALAKIAIQSDVNENVNLIRQIEADEDEA